MTSSYAVLQRLANSLFAKTGQSESLSKLVSNFSKNKKSKSTAATDKSLTSSTEKMPSSPKVSPKDSPKTNTILTTAPETYVIDNKYLDHFEKDKETEIFIIYLNRPFDLQTLRSLHKISSYTIMADGAANRFHDKFVTQADEEEIIPHALVGDFDSIRKDVMGYYKERDVKVFHDKSQDDTDLEKCLRHLQQRFQEENLYTKEKNYRIIITGGFGGRMDHTLNNIHILHKFAEKFLKKPNVSLHLIDNNSIGTCILPGKTTYIRSKHFEQDAGCGMFPLLGEQAKVQTKGLKWDVGSDAPALSFKKFVSSSNEMLGEVVEFETDSIIFWTTTNTIHGKRSED